MEKTTQLNKSESGIILECMDEVRRICALGNKARAEAGIKTRQPLKSIRIKSSRLLELFKELEELEI